MQHGGNRAIGNVDEIEEYFADRNTQEESDVSAAKTIENDYSKNREEMRRLTALVAHLRDQVEEIGSQPEPHTNASPDRRAFPLISTLGLLAFGFIGTLWGLRRPR